MHAAPTASSAVPRAFVALAALSLVGLAALALPPAAPGQNEGARKGSVRIALGAPGAKALADLGVRAAPIKPAKKRRGGIVLPVRGGTVGAKATLDLRGGLRFARGRGANRKALGATRLRLELGRKSKVTAKVGGRRLALLAIASATGKGATLDRTTGRASLRGARISFTRRGGAALKRALGLAKRPTGRLGTLAVSARVEARPKSGGQGGGGQVQPGGDTPKSGPIVDEPPLLARPATAVDVTAVSVSWMPRDSWIRYVSSGTGPQDGVRVSNGASTTKSKASPCPNRPNASDALLDYAIHFQAGPSWYDPVSGQAGIYGTGAVSFKWVSHTIDVVASDPEVEINGAASRLVLRLNGSGGTAFPNQRAALLDLDVTGQPTISPDGKTFTYSLVRGNLTPDGQAAFAGFYVPPDDHDFGCVSVGFTVP